MPKSFNVGIKAVVVSKGRALILKRHSTIRDRQIWDAPGGRIDDDETILETLDRELNEEVPNIGNYKVGELINAYRVPGNLSGDKGLVLIFYRVEADHLEKVELSAEHSQYRWVQISDLDKVAKEPKVLLSDDYRKTIELALQNTGRGGRT